MTSEAKKRPQLKSIFFYLLSDQVTSSAHHTHASWWLECGATRRSLLWGPWHSGGITVLNPTAQPAALTGTRPTTSLQRYLTSSACSSFATCCPAPSSSSPTHSSCWQCAGHVKPSSSMCHRRPRPPMRTLSLSRSEDVTCVYITEHRFYRWQDLSRIWHSKSFKRF